MTLDNPRDILGGTYLLHLSHIGIFFFTHTGNADTANNSTQSANALDNNPNATNNDSIISGTNSNAADEQHAMFDSNFCGNVYFCNSKLYNFMNVVQLLLFEQ